MGCEPRPLRRATVTGAAAVGTGLPMPSASQTLPRPGQLWLSRPPYLILARVVEVDTASEPAVLSYELRDEDGSLLEAVRRAELDRGWWRTFQPLTPRFG
jgi:hypothetical protein